MKALLYKTYIPDFRAFMAEHGIYLETEYQRIESDIDLYVKNRRAGMKIDCRKLYVRTAMYFVAYLRIQRLQFTEIERMIDLSHNGSLKARYRYYVLHVNGHPQELLTEFGFPLDAEEKAPPLVVLPQARGQKQTEKALAAIRSLASEKDKEKIAGVSGLAIESRTRNHPVVLVRQMVLYYMRHHEGMTLKAASSILNRDHTTTIHSIRKVEEYAATGMGIEGRISRLLIALCKEEQTRREAAAADMLSEQLLGRMLADGVGIMTITGVAHAIHMAR